RRRRADGRRRLARVGGRCAERRGRRRGGSGLGGSRRGRDPRLRLRLDDGTLVLGAGGGEATLGLRPFLLLLAAELDPEERHVHEALLLRAFFGRSGGGGRTGGDAT